MVLGAAQSLEEPKFEEAEGKTPNKGITWALGVQSAQTWGIYGFYTRNRILLVLGIYCVFGYLDPLGGGCQNYGPLLGSLNTRSLIVLRTQKGTIVLTTTHMSHGQNTFYKGNIGKGAI